MEQIANYYLSVAKAQIRQNNPSAASNSIANGLLAIADFPPLLSLQADLTEILEKPVKPILQSDPDNTEQLIEKPSPTHRDTPSQQVATPIRKPATQAASIAEAKKASQLRDKQRREQQLREKRLEAKRLAEKREREARIAAAQRLEHKRVEQLASERLVAQQREMEIKQLLSAAEQQLLKKPLDATAIEKALTGHQALVKIADKDSRVIALYRKIIFSHITLATQQKTALLFSESMDTVNRGLELDADNKQLLTLQKEITEAARKAKNKTDDLPIIGTF